MVPLRDAGQIRGGQHPDLRRPLSPVHHLPGSTHLSRPFLLPNRRWSARRFRHGPVSPSCTCVALPALLPSHCPHFEGKQCGNDMGHGSLTSHFPLSAATIYQHAHAAMYICDNLACADSACACSACACANLGCGGRGRCGHAIQPARCRGTDVGLASGAGWVFFWTRLALLPAAPAPGRLCFVALLLVRDVVR